MAEFAFVQIIAVAAVVAILAQCSVYLVRHRWGVAAALGVLRWSLGGFAFVTVSALIWSWASGDLASALERLGARVLADTAMFIGFTMFISYFMGSRYLTDERERTRAREGPVGSGSGE